MENRSLTSSTLPYFISTLDDSTEVQHNIPVMGGKIKLRVKLTHDLLLLLVVARHTAHLTLEYNNTLPQFHHTIAPGKSVILLLRLLTQVLSILLNGTKEKTS
ncbi:hypothetical protein E2C01_025370 [Portunus trituberculatus]|uniref:Uncharacterized protein n=1 Tax=Portunus trituberculatus TaxID=210409 RepID=A0A5B7EF03_PORTR|nr:hypothetical protein [Portunus trituberculatus]